MAKIEVNSYDLCIGTTKSGDRVLQFKNGFDEEVIQEFEAQGVKPRPIRGDGETEELDE